MSGYGRDPFDEVRRHAYHSGLRLECGAPYDVAGAQRGEHIVNVKDFRVGFAPAGRAPVFSNDVFILSEWAKRAHGSDSVLPSYVRFTSSSPLRRRAAGSLASTSQTNDDLMNHYTTQHTSRAAYRPRPTGKGATSTAHSQWPNSSSCVPVR